MKKMKTKLYVTVGSILVASFAPLIVYAQASNLDDVIEIIGDLLDLVLPIIVIIALIYFFWGLAQYILKAGEEADREKARQTMIYGIIILFVIVSVWGLVNLLQATFTPTNPETLPVPTVTEQRPS